jgi:hypothetical protein
MALNLCRVCDIAVGLKKIMLSKIVKKSANLSCSYGLFGLSGLFGWRLTRWTRQTGLVSEVPISDVLTCHNSLFHNLLKTRKRVGVSKSSLPTVAPVMWSIVAQAVEERRVIIWRSEDPGATQVETESHRGIGVEGRDRLHDGGLLCQLTLQIGTRGCLTIELIF